MSRSTLIERISKAAAAADQNSRCRLLLFLDALTEYENTTPATDHCTRAKNKLWKVLRALDPEEREIVVLMILFLTAAESD